MTAHTVLSRFLSEDKKTHSNSDVNFAIMNQTGKSYEYVQVLTWRKKCIAGHDLRRNKSYEVIENTKSWSGPVIIIQSENKQMTQLFKVKPLKN